MAWSRRPMRGQRWAIAVVACAVLASAPAADTHPSHGAVQVAVGQFKYAPADVSIYAGDSVVWTRSGPDTNHSVTADAGQAMNFRVRRRQVLRSRRPPAEIDFDSPPGPGVKRLRFKKLRNGKYLLRLIAVDNVSGLTSKPAEIAVEVRG